jgi:penicillin-binding protein 1A
MASNLPAVIRRSKWRGLAFWKRVTFWTLIGGGSLALLAFIALLIAVYSTKSSLPSFDELKSSPNGQMIRVHAADGTVLVSLGPSYGEWIKYDRSRR